MKNKSLISWLRPFTEALYRQGTSIKLHKGRYNVYNNEGSFIIAYPDRASAAAHAREIEVREWYKRTKNWMSDIRKKTAAAPVEETGDVMQLFDAIEQALNNEKALLSGKEVAASQVRTAATEEVPKIDNTNPIDPTIYIERPPVKPVICIFDIPIKDKPPSKDVTEKENMPFTDHPKTGYEGNMKWDENVTGPDKNPCMKDSQNPDPAFGEGYLTSSLNVDAVRYVKKPQELTPEELAEQERFEREKLELEKGPRTRTTVVPEEESYIPGEEQKPPVTYVSPGEPVPVEEKTEALPEKEETAPIDIHKEITPYPHITEGRTQKQIDRTDRFLKELEEKEKKRQELTEEPVPVATGITPEENVDNIKTRFTEITYTYGHPITEAEYNAIASQVFPNVPKEDIQKALQDLKSNEARLVIYPEISTLDRASLETKDASDLMSKSDALLNALSGIVNTVTPDLKNISDMQNEYLESINNSLSVEDTILKRPNVDPGFLANMRENALTSINEELQRLVSYKTQMAPLFNMQAKAKDYINKINEIIYQTPSEKSEFGLPKAPKTVEGIQSLLTNAYDLINNFKGTYESAKNKIVDFGKTVSPTKNKRYDYIKDLQRHVKPAVKTSLKTAAMDEPQLTEEDIVMIDEAVAERRRELSEELKKQYVSSDIAVKGPQAIGDEINAVLDAYITKFKDMLSKRVLIDKQKGTVSKETKLDIFMHKTAQEEDVPEETEGREYEETPTTLSPKYENWEAELPSDVVNKIHEDIDILIERERDDLESRGYSSAKISEEVAKFETEQLERMLTGAYSEYSPESAEGEEVVSEEPEMAEITGVNVLLDKSVEKADAGLRKQMTDISKSSPAYASLSKDDKEEFEYMWKRVLARIFPYAKKHFYSSTSELLKTLQKEFNYAIEEKRMVPRSEEERKRHLLKSQEPLSPVDLGKRKESFMKFVYDRLISSAGDSDEELNNILSILEDLANVIAKKNKILKQYPGVSFGLATQNPRVAPYLTDVPPLGSEYEEHLAKKSPEAKALQDAIKLTLRGMDIASNRVTHFEEQIVDISRKHKSAVIEKSIVDLQKSYEEMNEDSKKQYKDEIDNRIIELKKDLISSKRDLATKVEPVEKEMAVWVQEHTNLGTAYEQLSKKLDVLEKTKIAPAREELHGKTVPKKTQEGFDSLIQTFNSTVESLDDPVYRYFLYKQYDMLLEDIVKYTEGTKPETEIYEPTKRRFPIKSALDVKEFNDYIAEAKKANVNEVRSSWIFDVLEAHPGYEDVQTRSALLHEALSTFDDAKFNIINRKELESAIRGLEKAE